MRPSEERPSSSLGCHLRRLPLASGRRAQLPATRRSAVLFHAFSLPFLLPLPSPFLLPSLSPFFPRMNPAEPPWLRSFAASAPAARRSLLLLCQRSFSARRTAAHGQRPAHRCFLTDASGSPPPPAALPRPSARANVCRGKAWLGWNLRFGTSNL